MVSQLNSSAIRSAYASNLGENKEVPQKQSTQISKQGNLSRVEQIKEQMNAGTYKVDLEALSQKLADELL